MGEYHFVLQNADWAGDVKDRRIHSGISVWVKNSDENFGYLVQCSPGHDVCNYSPGRSVLYKDSAATLSFLKRSLSDRYDGTMKEMVQRRKMKIFRLVLSSPSIRCCCVTAGRS